MAPDGILEGDFCQDLLAGVFNHQTSRLVHPQWRLRLFQPLCMVNDRAF